MKELDAYNSKFSCLQVSECSGFQVLGLHYFDSDNESGVVSIFWFMLKVNNC